MVKVLNFKVTMLNPCTAVEVSVIMFSKQAVESNLVFYDDPKCGWINRIIN